MRKICGAGKKALEMLPSTAFGAQGAEQRSAGCFTFLNVCVFMLLRTDAVIQRAAP